ncbi:hypothetical protein [Lutibacter flavus]|uniref:Uncharacterized protein n=1 Tax=Lutibacter flavus TaxID=691689 RepID=A0A238XYY5_9FLAO|nr:hypothetical protein [Lutibacter flavus]SNR63920.1 hypothetical protein SAMN04488111_2216 [Lutibacter flavus]
MIFQKRVLILLVTFLIYNFSYSQKITIKNIESRLITHQGVEFVGELKDLSNDTYLYPNYSNEGVLYYANQKYIISNINFNATTNSFESRIKRDKLFSFKSSLIDSIKINNHLFKNINNTFYEVLFEKGENAFLKKHDIEYREGAINRLDGKVGRTRTYLIYNFLVKLNGDFKKLELNKKGITELFVDNKYNDSIEQFVDKERLSYKKENDVIKILKFGFKILNKDL